MKLDVKTGRRRQRWWSGALLGLCIGTVLAADPRLPDTVERIKASVVGVGTLSETHRPPAILRGTGFAVGDGSRVVTNCHVIDQKLDEAHKERHVVFLGRGREARVREVEVVARDDVHDLCALKMSGAPLPPVTIDESMPREGTAIAFTGFPLGATLGLYHVTHQGIVSAITPIAIPAPSARLLSSEKIQALRSPFDVLQLDATAYPGNSGSPVFRQDNGQVVAVVSQVAVAAKKEDLLSHPSAITYAMPAGYIRALLQQTAPRP